jgi:hypothetical protein
MYAVAPKKPQTRPKWPSRKTPEPFKARVEREMRDRGINRSTLAKMIGVSAASITGFFDPDQPSSRLVDPIIEALDMPGPEFIDDRDYEVIADIRRIRKVSPEEYDRIASKIRKIATDTQKP